MSDKRSGIEKLTNPEALLQGYWQSVVHQYRETDYIIVDEDIRDIVAKINEVSGVLVTDCCASHPERERHNLYLAFLPTTEGFDFLADLYNHFVGQVLNEAVIGNLVSQIQFRVRHRQVDVKFQEWGTIWSIRLPVDDQNVKDRALTCLRRAVDNAIGDLRREPVGDPS
ncbi:hypothetical protein PA10_00173 [Pseudomonas phage pPa_SNUABM_DT01]|nr:hypothetical protein PA10_00173 [Pseudomonas phage pPa_SNUABM_DT01]